MAVYSKLMSFAHSRCSGTAIDAEAIVMDVVTSTYRVLDGGRAIKDIEAFMITGVKHLLISHFKRRAITTFEYIGKRHDNIPASEEITNPQAMIECTETAVDQHNVYAAAMKRIKTRTRRGYDVLRMKLSGLSLKEIAVRLGLSENTARPLNP